MDAQRSTDPILDLAIAAQHADAELHTITSQFSCSAAVTTHMMTALATDKDDESENESSDDEVINLTGSQFAKTKTTSECSSSDSDEEIENTVTLRAEIESAMEKENNKASAPLTTEHEIVLAPVREFEVELTVSCPIEQCGIILNVSVSRLMMTVKSNPNTKPLDEGSVLCLEDRTVLGCVDEVFGPVLMPMYLIRFKSADKIPKTMSVNTAVFFAKEHTTYIVPDKIKDKGTDASNIFDEEANEIEFSDDEAEAAAKRSIRKRNRGGVLPASSESSGSASVIGGHRGRSGRDGRTSYRQGRHATSRQQSPMPPIHTIPTIPAMQTQPFGGVTKYTQSGGHGIARPFVHGSINYTSPRGHQPQYSGVRASQGHISAHCHYQPPLPPQYNGHNVPFFPQHGVYQQYFPGSSAPNGQLLLPPQPPFFPPPPVLYSQPSQFNQQSRGAPSPPLVYHAGEQQNQNRSSDQRRR
ncbi:Uncharacterized conserved protein [Plasmopara halstedii]|uniref:H/ACA ribonucleoprotein complex non-core subunit NAF1 n=1 Tax=Plasmopara halstedii TaxID=4781 RepID=A0A0P1AA11_PLAHL|nr:Uncharacterized conserved protein [Plasmopara halstedii]CEG37209.1 Uncharacterized conserved protein [Plasmopara halstedii]|eukprot:XP_024573578.1 Uncharacterized conserved protein [Plasmopara halstedii]